MGFSLPAILRIALLPPVLPLTVAGAVGGTAAAFLLLAAGRQKCIPDLEKHSKTMILHQIRRKPNLGVLPHSEFDGLPPVHHPVQYSILSLLYGKRSKALIHNF